MSDSKAPFSILVFLLCFVLVDLACVFHLVRYVQSSRQFFHCYYVLEWCSVLQDFRGNDLIFDLIFDPTARSIQPHRRNTGLPAPKVPSLLLDDSGFLSFSGKILSPFISI